MSFRPLTRSCPAEICSSVAAFWRLQHDVDLAELEFVRLLELVEVGSLDGQARLRAGELGLQRHLLDAGDLGVGIDNIAALDQSSRIGPATIG